ncbi:hypothetical protein JAAARDRAFT_189531 [Jaapia argillacea MUCL 33604]|uniref:Plasmid pRiA4b Orf3-like domain-containing protein n=1 Tax=Jaapia argillacea MUCL 33604 TaxID=933084 RepID=A0A067Q7K5_9AGAM|nr:hypothetical protein JAAARDRAFT_189531 [Jaapia argillacea MUCL 33604]
MPLSNATNTSGALVVAPSTSSKRSRSARDENESFYDDPSSENAKPQKKRCVKDVKPDPHTTLPTPTSEFIQLRFQLARFKGVFRIVQLPQNYTFANLHTFIQFAFGWGGSHAHQSFVWSNVEMYSGNYKKGEIAMWEGCCTP